MYEFIVHRTHISHLRIGEVCRFTSVDFRNFSEGVGVAEGEFHAPNPRVELSRSPDRGPMA